MAAPSACCGWPAAATLELCLLGQPIDAARAAQLGVLTRVVPADQLEAETIRLAEQLAQSAPQALRGVLDAVLLGGETLARGRARL